MSAPTSCDYAGAGVACILIFSPVAERQTPHLDGSENVSKWEGGKPAGINVERTVGKNGGQNV